MIKPFLFSRLPLLVFGYGRVSELPSFIMRYGTRVLLVTGKDTFLQYLRY